MLQQQVPSVLHLSDTKTFFTKVFGRKNSSRSLLTISGILPGGLNFRNGDDGYRGIIYIRKMNRDKFVFITE